MKFGELWWSFLEATSWKSLKTCLILSLILVRMHVRVVPDVTDVPVSVSFVDNEFCDGFWCCSDWEFGGTPCSLLYRYAGRDEVRQLTSESASAIQKKSETTPTPLQSSYSSFEEEQGHSEVEDPIWSARDRTVIATMKRYLEVSQNEGGS